MAHNIDSVNKIVKIKNKLTLITPKINFQLFQKLLKIFTLNIYNKF